MYVFLLIRLYYTYYDPHQTDISRRNLALAPRHSKEIAYKTLVRPQLLYAVPIWNPYHKLQIKQVEKAQRSAAR